MAARRYQGRLKKWNAERGYGFIVASDSGQDIFVHITAFPAMAVVGWYGYSRYESRVAQIKAVDASPAPAALFEPAQSAPSAFNCDGRKYCSQMTSCAEAKLFLKNCPGMEMDGDNDGVPCEQQWCN
ncbi:excalibur calcium-binding domain-containing protein [Rhodoferax sp.]|uniref:excalibur calcium-binding domain-containing protein n=1 Tax=Rhodoferax sp. TaxID=50421 RepID=UPI002850FC2C|nr:excalibur calcium-binding domain-containing protein [Rhodoferax sp.]MDR3369478.1 excalibur calcium-binding domain-containing protein [Rhodoferax sp.]